MLNSNRYPNPRRRNSVGQALQALLIGLVVLGLLGAFTFSAKKGWINLSPVQKTTFPDPIPADPADPSATPAPAPAAAAPAPSAGKVGTSVLPASIKELIAAAGKDAESKKRYEGQQKAIEDNDEAIRKATKDKLADLAMADGMLLSNTYGGDCVVSRTYGVTIRSAWRHGISTDCSMEFTCADKSTKVVDAILLPNGTDIMIPTKDLPRGMDINGRILGYSGGLPQTLVTNFWTKSDENGDHWVAFQRAAE